MTAISTALEYAAVREAIQQLTTLDANGNRRDTVSFNLGDLSVAYSGAQLPQLQAREIELARRLSCRNVRKRVTPDFSGESNTSDIGL